MKKHFLLLVILTLFPFIASNAVGNRALNRLFVWGLSARFGAAFR